MRAQVPTLEEFYAAGNIGGQLHPSEHCVDSRPVEWKDIGPANRLGTGADGNLNPYYDAFSKRCAREAAEGAFGWSGQKLPRPEIGSWIKATVPTMQAEAQRWEAGGAVKTAADCWRQENGDHTSSATANSIQFFVNCKLYPVFCETAR